MSMATRPTKPAAIHSIASMKRSMKWRVMSRSDEAAGLWCQGVVLGERGLQFRKRRVRVHAGLADAVAPGLDQRLGRLPPRGGLFLRQRVNFLAGLGFDLVEARVLELAPGLANAPRSLGVAVVV